MKGIPLDASLRSYDSAVVSDETATETGPDSVVQQQFLDDADINVIMRRYGMTSAMPSGVAGGVYGDFTGITDYESAVAAIERAQEGFMKLPPEVRERFDNDPAQVIRMAESLDVDGFVEAMTPRPAVPVVPVVPAKPAVS